jgi:uncharacterized membrane protein (DUF485 family)
LVYNGLHITDLQSQKNSSLAFASIDILFMLLLLLLLLLIAFHHAFAASPAFDQIFITDEEFGNQTNDWVQTYGHDSTI